MTEYVEVENRDGAARVGTLRLREPVQFPALVGKNTSSGNSNFAYEGNIVERAEPHTILADAGSEWVADREVPEGEDTQVTILPHRGFPGGTPSEVQSAFAVDYPDVDVPGAAVVTPDTAGDLGADVYVLSNAQELAGHAAAFVSAVVRTRGAIPADTALYLPGVATPGNVATLVYAGIDLVDADRAVLAGSQGRYLTVEGDRDLDALQERPCSCPACQQPLEKFDRAACAAHNVNALAAALATVRERIRAGRLRDYLEGQARHEQWHTGVLRRLDQQYGHLEQRTPVIRQSTMAATSDDAIRRVEIQRFAHRVTTRYRNRFSNPLVLVPCSATKPYSESQSHGQFHDAIQFRGHTVSMTSPIGVVPQELELTYPAQHYDAVVTGHWSETERAFVADVLADYLRRNEYPRIIAHVPPEGYRDIVEHALDAIDREPEVEFTVADHPTTGDSLANLASTLSSELKYAKRKRQVNTIRAVADFQFGDGAGDAIFEDIRISSRYPKLRAHDADGEQLAALVPNYGVLAFTLAGARRWLESDAPTKLVEIDDFVPHGNVLAPGVVDASETIRVGEEVVVRGPSAVGVGRAAMSGPEMVESSRGVATAVRHVAER